MKIIKKTNNIFFVQYLRGTAALSVLIAHSLEYPLGISSRNVLITGRLGVILFFVISGFIMVLVTGQEKFNARSFLIKRFIRIVPYYWIVTLFTAVIAFLAPFAFRNTTVSISHVITSLLFIPFNPVSGSLPIVKLGWTLNYEIFFYIIFSMLSAFYLNSRVIILFFLFTLLAIIGQSYLINNSFINFYTNFILVSFLGGAIIGALYLRTNILNISNLILYYLAVASLFLLIIIYLYQRNYNFVTISATMIMIFFSCNLLLLGLWIENKSMLYKSSSLVFFGDASYSIYLTHLFGVGLAVFIGKKLTIPLYGVGYMFIVFSALFTGLAFSLLSFLFIEKPIINKIQSMFLAKRVFLNK